MVTACEDCLTLGAPDDIISQFWPVWLEQEKKLYHRCLALMNGNVTEAEDALSSAKLKAWERVQKFADSIRDLKAWLMQLTSNLCKDIIEKNSRVAVEDIEWVGDNGVLCTASGVATPMMVLEREELYVVIRQAVESLPQGQRDTFVLHYYEGLKHKEIVEELGISYDSVCQQLSKARKQLKTKLRGYFCDEEELETALEQKVPKSRAPRGTANLRKIVSQQQYASNPNSDFSLTELRTENSELRTENSDEVEEVKNYALVSSTVALTLISHRVENGSNPNSDFSLTEHRTENTELRTENTELRTENSELRTENSDTPLFIVDKQNILEDDTTGMVSASVTAGSICTADDVMGVVQVNVEHESTQFCTWWEASSPVRAPVASGELLLFSPLGGETAIKAPECVQVSDIVGENISDVPGLGSAREPSPPDIVEMRTRPLSDVLSLETVRAGSAIAPGVVDRKPDDVSTVDVDHMLWDDGSSVRSQRYTSVSTAREWVHVRDIVGKNILKVCALGSAREHSPPGRVEKRTRPLGSELDYETVTVKVVSAIAPVVVDRKPDDVSTVDVDHMLWDDGSRVRSQRYTSVSTAREWVPVRDIVGKNILGVAHY